MPRRFSGPLLPGTTSVRQFNRRNRKYKRGTLTFGRGRRSLNNRIKNVSLRQCETKQSNQYTSTLQTLFHDRTYYSGQLLATTQGFTAPQGLEQAVNNRIGDKVVARGVKLRIYVENEAARPNVMYRIFIFKYNTLLLAGGAALQDNEFWEGPAGQGALTNRMLGKVQTRHIKILKSKLVKPTYQANYTPQSAGPIPNGPYSKTDLHSFWIPMKNKQIQYRDPDSTFPIRDGLGFAIVAFDTQGSFTTDHISNIMWQSTFYYKDP